MEPYAWESNKNDIAYPAFTDEPDLLNTLAPSETISKDANSISPTFWSGCLLDYLVADATSISNSQTALTITDE
jgi:hypothetical protein